MQDGQEGTPTRFEIADAGDTLHVAGNAWKTFIFPCDVTEKTVIEFEFRSRGTAQIHAIGFDMPGEAYGIVQFMGTEKRPSVPRLPQMLEAADDWRTITVPIGRFYQGWCTRLLFVNDDDVSASSASWFRNVRVYEAP